MLSPETLMLCNQTQHTFPVSTTLRRRRGAGRRWLGGRPRPAGRNPKPKLRGITPTREFVGGEDEREAESARRSRAPSSQGVDVTDSDLGVMGCRFHTLCVGHKMKRLLSCQALTLRF